MVRIWSQMHGFIAGYNNTFLDYMHGNPVELKDRIAGSIAGSFQREGRGSALSQKAFRPPASARRSVRESLGKPSGKKGAERSSKPKRR